jgi:hypothetical protein
LSSASSSYAYLYSPGKKSEKRKPDRRVFDSRFNIRLRRRTSIVSSPEVNHHVNGVMARKNIKNGVIPLAWRIPVLVLIVDLGKKEINKW